MPGSPGLGAILGLLGQSPGQGQDLGVEGHEVGIGVVGGFEQQLPVDRLVDESAGWWGGETVDRAARVEKNQRLFKCLLYVLDLMDGSLLPAFGLGTLTRNPILLGPKNVLGDGIPVVELDELLLLGGQLVELPVMAFGLSPCDVGLAFDVLVQRISESLSLVLRQDKAVVHAFDGTLDGGYAQVGCLALLPRPDTREAAEILVLSAGLGAVPTEAETSAASAAEDRALEVVVMLGGAVATGSMGLQDFLHLLEGGGVDDRLVLTLHLDAVAGDDADVVVVLEHPVDGRAIQLF